MKLAIDCRMIGSGGIGSYITSLLPYFARDFQCLFIGRKADLEIYSNNKNVEVIDCDLKTFSIKELFLFPKKILNKINNCDLYYTPYCNIPGGIKIPVYSTIHDVVFLDIKLSSKIGTIARKWFYQHAINKSKAIFTVSEFSKERIFMNLKCRKPVFVTYSALPEWFRKSGQKEEKTNTVLFVGNIKPHKGLQTLLQAMKICIENKLDAKLVIVGNSENFRSKDTNINRYFDMLDSNHLLFTGRISNEELQKYYKQANLYVMPSLYEGFGMPPLEALSLGTNVILSDIPVLREIYKEYPVQYFKVGNAESLASKIIENFNSPEPENIPDLYTFSNTYTKIKEILVK